MMQIRPVTDLVDKFVEIEKDVKEGEAVFLTKDGYGTMVVISLEKYTVLTGEKELVAEEANTRLSKEEVFHILKQELQGKRRY